MQTCIQTCMHQYSFIIIEHTYLKPIMTEEENNPTLKGRFLTLERLAKKMRTRLNESDQKIRDIVLKNEQGTQLAISAQRISHIRQILAERLDQIQIKINKHLSEQKEKNEQMMELIGMIRSEKNILQAMLEDLKAKLYAVQVKIGEEDAEV